MQSGGFPVYRAEPDGEPKGALIVIHEVWGLTDHIKNVADRFAAEGYLVLAPNLISDVDIERHMTPDMPKDLFNPKTRNAVQPKLREIMAPIQTDEFAEQTTQKLVTLFEQLSAEPGIDGRVGVVGYCFGGTYSFRLAVHEPRLKAAVPFYGHANFSSEQLKQITCPILALYGENDQNLMSALPRLKENMQAARVDFEVVAYPDCGHAFFNDTNPFAYNEAAAKDAWPKTLHFLEEHLR
jgi:carboxymethylenebutenolidase